MKWVYLSQLQQANYLFYLFIPPPPEFPVLQIRVPPEFPDLRFPTFPVRGLQADVGKHHSKQGRCVPGRIFAVPDRAEVSGDFFVLIVCNNITGCIVAKQIIDCGRHFKCTFVSVFAH